jgi:hypothetical protein
MERIETDVFAGPFLADVCAADLSDEEGDGVVEVLRLVGECKGGTFSVLRRDRKDDRPHVPVAVLVATAFCQTALPEPISLGKATG